MVTAASNTAAAMQSPVRILDNAKMGAVLKPRLLPARPVAAREVRLDLHLLYALDAVTGKELWNSGNTITSFAHGGGLAGGAGQVYLTTFDNTFYAFGFPTEH